MNYYVVANDKQGGEFGMGRCYTAEQWGKQAMEWADSDGSEDADHWLLDSGDWENEDELICNIADYWEIVFARLNEEQKKEYENYLKEIDAKERRTAGFGWKEYSVLTDAEKAELAELNKLYYEYQNYCWSLPAVNWR